VAKKRKAEDSRKSKVTWSEARLDPVKNEFEFLLRCTWEFGDYCCAGKITTCVSSIEDSLQALAAWLPTVIDELTSRKPDNDLGLEVESLLEKVAYRGG
jgi:hypothetical protein